MFNSYATQFLLEVDVNQPIANLSDKLAYGGKMLLVGMGIVFAVLVLLCIVLYLFSAVSSHLFGGEKQTKVVAPKKEAPAPAAIPQPIQNASNEQEEIIAVIAAAIAAASAENPSAKFRVVSFKRK